MSELNITEENSAEIRERLIYSAAVVANIRNRLDAFYECYMDDSDLLKIWANAPWLSSAGNLHERIKGLAREMDADVYWPKKSEAHFVRKIPVIEVVG